ncbi:unnamed protein product [Periconia digitata]|uniref:Uncharacterized protein n=1 Tax=Periconia digitata TaxID=1303443 RepID=A0A9W4XMN3_9PLEO|nr:unnamed protein product [Periconia digitata]
MKPTPLGVDATHVHALTTTPAVLKVLEQHCCIGNQNNSGYQLGRGRVKKTTLAQRSLTLGSCGSRFAVVHSGVGHSSPLHSTRND